MPIERAIEFEKSGVVGVWRIDEPETQLLAHLQLRAVDRERLAAIKHSAHRSQWLASRLLLQQLHLKAGGVNYDATGKPEIEGSNWKLSISHSDKRVAVQLHPTQECGVDIQCFQPKIARLEPRFCSATERAFLPDGAAERLKALHICWSAKEALFKWYALGGVNFAEHLSIQPFAFAEEGALTAEIALSGHKSKHNLRYCWVNGYILVYVLKDY